MIKALRATQDETGEYYRGILYGQLILTQEGVFLIEFNCRFGDPEAMNILPLLEGNSLDIYQQMIDKRLREVPFRPEGTVCVYLVPKGYPTNPEKYQPVLIPPNTEESLFFASVYEKDGIIRTTGSRAIAVLGRGHSVEEARKRAYDIVGKFDSDLFYRSDIAVGIE